MKKSLIGALILSALSLLLPNAWAGPYAKCRIEKCDAFSEAELDRVSKGETVVESEKDPASKLNLSYVVTSIGKVDPVFATATFIDFDRHTEIDGIEEVKAVSRGDRVLVSYKLDVSETLSGVGKIVSKLGGYAYYAGNETLFTQEGAYGVEWLIDEPATLAMNSEGQGNPKTMPSHFHGYVFYKYFPKYDQTFQFYAGYQVVEELRSFWLKPFLGLINSSSESSLKNTAMAFAKMMRDEKALPDSERKAGWKERCETVIKAAIPQRK